MIDELTCSTSSTGFGEIVWKEGVPGSPEAARPILLAVGKEDKDLLNKLIPPVDEICNPRVLNIGKPLAKLQIHSHQYTKC